MASDPLVKEIYIEASPNVVFAFLTDPTKMLRWMGVAVEIDPRPGGIYRMDPNGREKIRGTYIEVVPNSRIVFTWGWEDGAYQIPSGSTVVEIDLEARDQGTLLRLTHRELPPEARDQHAGGWTHYLSRLRIVAEGGEPGFDVCADPAVPHGRRR